MGKRIHFVGIGGAGMSAIARVLLAEGEQVSGSDLQDSAVTDDLRRAGATVYIGHRPEQVRGADEVVVSTAIAPDNPEVVEARRLGIPVRHRSEALADLLNARQGVAVAGAHGKTTITSMIAWALHRTGESVTFLIGGVLPGIGGAGAGTGPFVVAEADESDRSFLRYRPFLAVVTSIEPDHLEYYENSFAQLQEAYRQFLDNVKEGGVRVLCTDDPTLQALAGLYGGRDRLVTYGLSRNGAAGIPAYGAAEVAQLGFRSTFRLVKEGRPAERVELAVPGRHNVQNALACLAATDALGVDRGAVIEALAAFRGARRRLEVVGDENGILVIDDYAHHPTEIKATLAACRAAFPDRRLIAVFQPHRYSRTAQLGAEFAGSFPDADAVVLTEIYAPPPERPLPGVSGETLAREAEARTAAPVRYAPDLDAAVDAVRSIARPGDVVVTMGAGDVWKVARRLAGRDAARY